MLPKEGDEVLRGLKIDEIHLLEDVGLEFLLVAEVRLVAHSSLPDDDAVGRHLLQGWILRLGLLEHACLLVAMFERIDTQKLLLLESGLEAVHSAKFVIMAVCRSAW
jgi:hypothetical protein